VDTCTARLHIFPNFGTQCLAGFVLVLAMGTQLRKVFALSGHIRVRHSSVTSTARLCIVGLSKGLAYGGNELASGCSISVARKP